MLDVTGSDVLWVQVSRGPGRKMCFVLSAAVDDGILQAGMAVEHIYCPMECYSDWDNKARLSWISKHGDTSYVLILAVA